MIFALSGSSFGDRLTGHVLSVNSAKQNYDLTIVNASEPIVDWTSYESTWVVDRLQKGLSCCGIVGDFHDWHNVTKEKYQRTDIYPKSCCKHPFRNMEKNWEYCDGNIYPDSCPDALRSSMQTLNIEMGVLCLLQVLMIIGAHIISFKVQDPSERPKSPAEIAWMQFVNAQYKTDTKRSMSRSKSVV